MNDSQVVRVVRRRAKAGCDAAYEALIRGMFASAATFPGYVSAQMIPPAQPGGEYQLVQRFASEADLDRWNASTERTTWLERLRTVAEGDPEYRVLSGLEAWFGPTVVPATAPPPRWKMTVVSWMGIFPTVALLLTFVAPLIAPLHFLLRTAIFTALVAILMSYVVMPRLSRWMHWWLRRSA
ncbi:MAG TPA: antibiotic biosynthesis monooxygenase [Burkholderiaceae bacterium]|nr:antibiotic biosynthesis monooxygenase [Burkholderiaceae bacterium]